MNAKVSETRSEAPREGGRAGRGRRGSARTRGPTATDALRQSQLALVVKSGKVTLGYKTTLKALRNGKARAVLLASNCPPLRRSELEYLAMLTKTDVHAYPGDTGALGHAMGKLYGVSVATVLDAGDSDFLSTVQA